VASSSSSSSNLLISSPCHHFQRCLHCRVQGTWKLPQAQLLLLLLVVVVVGLLATLISCPGCLVWQVCPTATAAPLRRPAWLNSCRRSKLLCGDSCRWTAVRLPMRFCLLARVLGRQCVLVLVGLRVRV
jgi:hypothetical protein